MKLLAIAALLLMPSAVAAAPPARGPTTNDSLQATRDFARCVVDKSPSAARRALALDYRTPEYGKTVRRLLSGHGRCIAPGGVLRGSQVLIIGALAETFLAEDLKVPLKDALAFNPASTPLVSRSVSETMALCMVRETPDEVARLVQAPIGAPAETAALDTLVKSLPACLAKDASMTLNMPGLRAVLALAAYRIAVANGAVRDAKPLGSAQ